MGVGDSLPYGLRDTKITGYKDDSNTTLATTGAVDQPNARTLSFTEAEDFEELRGDDRLIAIRGKGASVEWEMEHGGISLAAWKAMAGGSLVTSGTGTDLTTTYTKRVTDQRPYFRSEGQAISDNGGDFHTILYRCRASDSLEGELADGAFWLSTASGMGLPALLTGKEDVIYEFVVNSQVKAIAGSPAA